MSNNAEKYFNVRTDEPKSNPPARRAGLPTTKTKVVFSMTNLSALIYGIPKVGKSTFCAGAPDALFIATEAGLNHIECYNSPVTSWLEFLEICYDLNGDEHSFKTVIIDTVDNLYQLCTDYVLSIWSQKTGKSIVHEADLEYGKGWALVRAEFLRVMMKLSMCDFGLILISHATDKELETRTGTVCRVVPSLSNQAHKVIGPIVDLILYFELDKDQQRIIHCTPHTNYEAGDRTGRLPDSLSMNWNALANALTKESEGQAGKIIAKDKNKKKAKK